MRHLSEWIQFIGLSLILVLVTETAGKKCDRQLKGPGGCRGQNWDQGQWPILTGERTLEECCIACQKQSGCTGFHLAKAKSEKDQRSSCYLFGHKDLKPATALGGQCYLISRSDENDDDDDDDDDVQVTVEQCKKHIAMACPGPEKAKKPKDDSKPKPDSKGKEVENKKHKEEEETKRKEAEKKKKEEEKRKEEERRKKQDEEKRKAEEREEAKKKEIEQKKKAEEKKKQEEHKKQEEEKKKKEREEEERKKKEKEEKEKKEKEERERKQKEEMEEKQKAKREQEEKKKQEQEEKKKKEQEQKQKKEQEQKQKKEQEQKQKKEQEQKQKKEQEQKQKKEQEQKQKKEQEQKQKQKQKKEQEDKEEKPSEKKKRDTREKEKTPETPKVAPKVPKGKKAPDQIAFDGKYLSKIGDGGCRGKNWNHKGCPKEIGRKSKTDCAWECRKSEYCTAFHILKFSKKDQTYECLIFGHKDVLAVEALGGECYGFVDKPPKKVVKPQEEEPEIVRPVGTVRPIEIGPGMCRGKGWTFDDWPVTMGMKTLDQCAKACVDTYGCVAFDTSEGSGKKFMCNLYGHRDVVPASSVSGTCYTLFGSSLATKVALEKDDYIESIIEEEIEIELKEDAKFDLLGVGVCRGENWQNDKWPIVKGAQTVQECANACKKKRGCNSFDLTPPEEGKGKHICHLYGHKDPEPASSVPGNCYELDVDPNDEEDEEADHQADAAKSHHHTHVGAIIDDGSIDHLPHEGRGFELLGAGVCRGPEWSDEVWPKDEGVETFEACADECLKNEACTAFEITPSDRADKYRCHIYGHTKVLSASSIRGRCYRMLGRVAIPISSTRTGAAAKYNKVGDGSCRGEKWQSGDWPMDKGRRSEKECFAACLGAPGCTSFDTSKPGKSGKKIQCFLYGHEIVRAASAVEGTCFKMESVRPVAEKTTSKAAFDNANDLGEGLCRGANWQDGVNWPMDKGRRSMKECYTACKQTSGCTAFDISQPGKSGKKIQCYLYGHSIVEPASALEGRCYQMMLIKSGVQTGPKLAPNTVRVGDSALATKLDVGACRGPGWQDGFWPVVPGFLTKKGCAEACIRTSGCTAFDIRTPSAQELDEDQEQVERDAMDCTLFGHKNVIPASSVKGDCYTITHLDPGQVKAKKAKKPAAAAVPQAAAPAAPEKKKKNLKVPVFDAPKVLEDEVVDEGWLFDPPPPEVRSRKHIEKILHLADPPNKSLAKITEETLKDLKKIYEHSINPLETVYKYKELSNRHFGDPEIFNKPLIVLMGPWSGGKSSTLNYLLGTEYTTNSFKAGAEPSAGFNFNIALHGEQEEEISGTELAAEWSFSSLQKFGQEFLKKLKGKKMPNKLLEKAIFAEIPGVLETGSVRKIDRKYSFNDACQWFIDHADLILLVYDYTKLDIGPETEALLDQLKGRESQVRILLNKADEITAEELMKIQGNLVWNVSPLMSSNLEPPTLYAGSFWSHPYKSGALKELLIAQEMSLLRDINDAIEKRVENRISTSRRFAVRVRNHAKMVDVYLARFNSQKGIFGSKKKTAEDIIAHPEKYHIYEGISTMTNISRYDLPDPQTYRTFFGLHPLEEFPSLQSTCTFFKGCPINMLDLAIAYDLPELLTNYKRKIAKPAPKK